MFKMCQSPWSKLFCPKMVQREKEEMTPNTSNNPPTYPAPPPATTRAEIPISGEAGWSRACPRLSGPPSVPCGWCPLRADVQQKARVTPRFFYSRPQHLNPGHFARSGRAFLVPQ